MRDKFWESIILDMLQSGIGPGEIYDSLSMRYPEAPEWKMILQDMSLETTSSTKGFCKQAANTENLKVGDYVIHVESPVTGIIRRELSEEEYRRESIKAGFSDEDLGYLTEGGGPYFEVEWGNINAVGGEGGTFTAVETSDSIMLAPQTLSREPDMKNLDIILEIFDRASQLVAQLDAKGLKYRRVAEFFDSTKSTRGMKGKVDSATFAAYLGSGIEHILNTWNDFIREHTFLMAENDWSDKILVQELDETFQELEEAYNSLDLYEHGAPSAEDLGKMFRVEGLKGFCKQAQFGFGYHGDGQSNFSVPNSVDEKGPGNSGVDNTGANTPSSSYTDYQQSRINLRKEEEKARKRRKHRMEKLKKLKKKEAARPGDLIGPNRKNRSRSPGHLFGPQRQQRERAEELDMIYEEQIAKPEEALEMAEPDYSGAMDAMKDLTDTSTDTSQSVKDTGNTSDTARKKLEDLSDRAKSTTKDMETSNKESEELQDNVKKLDDALRKIM